MPKRQHVCTVHCPSQRLLIYDFLSLDTIAGQKIELSFTRNFWINVLFIIVLVALLLGWVMYVVKIAAAV
jgi:hypothetical protein